MALETTHLPQRRKRDAARTREDILRAARRRFADSGYSHVTLKDIADDVGITPAMIVRYFESKANLYREVVGQRANLLPRTPQERLDLHEVTTALLRYWADPDAHASTLSFIKSLDLDGGRLFGEEIDQFRAQWLDRLSGEDVEIRSWLIVGVSFGVGLFSAGALLPNHAASEDELARMEPYLEAFYRLCIDPAGAAATR